MSAIEKEIDLRFKSIDIPITSSKPMLQAHPPISISMAKKGDVEAYVDAVIAPQDEMVKNETTNDRGLKLLSRMKSAASWNDPDPPPDGGAIAWTQVLVGHLTIMNLW